MYIILKINKNMKKYFGYEPWDKLYEMRLKNDI